MRTHLRIAEDREDEHAAPIWSRAQLPHELKFALLRMPTSVGAGRSA
jgi:hypothetical protein